MRQHQQRIAIVGCGGVTDHYLSVYRALDFIEVATCIDANLERASAYAAQFSADAQGARAPRATTDFADALAEDVGTVIINTPNHLHREQATAALEAGKHVLLQKPVAANVNDAVAIAEAAARAAHRGVFSGLYMSYFDQPLMHDLRDMREAGWFGSVVQMYARLMHRGGMALSKQALNGQPSWRGSIEQTGGGCFIQLAVHYIHLFQWMTGARVVRATAVTKNLHSPGIEGEDLACAILEFETGALATIDTAWCTAGEQLCVYGTRGTAEYIGNRTLVLNSDAGAWRGRVVNFEAARPDLSPAPAGVALGGQLAEVSAPLLGDTHNPFNQQRMFLEAVRDGHAPLVSIAAGVEDMRVIAAVYESARTGRTIAIEREPSGA